MGTTKKKQLNNEKHLLLYISITIFVALFLITVTPQISTDDSVYKIKDKINKKINNSENTSIIFLNEYKACLTSIITHRPFSKKFKTINVKKFNENQKYIYDYCLSYQMNEHLKNDASRYDFLEKKINVKGLTFHLKDEKFDYNKLF